MPNLNFRQQNTCCTTCMFFRCIEQPQHKNYSVCLLIGKSLEMSDSVDRLLKNGRITVCDAWKRRPLNHTFKSKIVSYREDAYVDYTLITALRKKYNIKGE